jgi:hypothetical protein
LPALYQSIGDALSEDVLALRAAGDDLERFLA